MEPNTSSREAVLEELIASVVRTDAAYESAAWARLDSLTKPLRSLGRLEEIAARVARIQRTDHPSAEGKAVLLMAGDHGIVAEGVAPYPQAVTQQMVANFAAGGAAINQIAASVGAEVVVYDVGVAGDVALPNVEVRKVAWGTRSAAEGPAMTREEAARAALVGVAAVHEAVSRGVHIVGTGEMGIGNSTAAAALVAAYTGLDPSDLVGPGTGLDAAGVSHKARVVGRILEVNRVAELDALGVLAAVGGLEIAALAGVVIGAAAEGVCVIADGYIAGAAALAAVRLCPPASDYVLPSHLSREPGHRRLLDALGMEPLLALDMRLGEGTGAALAMGIVDAACRVLSGMSTFAEAGVSTAE